jgi:hypothetical protein
MLALGLGEPAALALLVPPTPEPVPEVPAALEVAPGLELALTLERPPLGLELARGDALPLDVTTPVLVEVPVVALTPEVPVEVVADPPPDVETPPHGATVADVSEVELEGEISTPATLQFSGICCSMISTKLIGPALLPVAVLVVVVVLVLPPAEAPVAPPEGEVEAPAAAPDAPAALDGRALAALEAPTAAPLDGAALEVEVVVVVVEVPLIEPVLRMSMKATVWPLLLRFRNVPAMGISCVPPEVLLIPVLVPAPVELPVAAVPLAVAKVPLHWFWVSICW